MTTRAPDTHDRFPTEGPEHVTLERYRVVTTATDETVIYDGEVADAWVQSDSVADLESWR